MIDKNAPQSRKRRMLWIVLFALFSILASACVGIVAYHIVFDNMMNNLYEQARVTVAYEDGENKSPILNGEPGGEQSNQEDDRVTVYIDFDLLRKTGKDVYAWIEVPGTKVAYPIVRHPTNNNFYVRRAINGAYDVSGCIFTENINGTDFQDGHTAIYGHYVSNGSKFGFLLNYMDADYFNSHREIDIYTETHKLTYTVFAATPFNTRHVITGYRFCDEPTEQFLADVYASTDKRAVFAEDVKVNPETDKIITLSTCMKSSSKRFLVLAVLTKSQLCN